MMRGKEQWICLWELIRCRAIHPSHLHTHHRSSPACRFADFVIQTNCFCSESPGTLSTCWKCNARSQHSPFLLCDSCQAIQPSHHSLDYFHFFGLERNYDVKENLDRKYKDWQKKLRPDLVHTKSQLKLKGVDVNEEDSISDPHLLAEIMDIREAVEEASGSKALTDIQTLMKEKLQQWANNFVKVVESQKYEEAIRCIQRMRSSQ